MSNSQTIKVGVAFFDDPDSPASGLCSLQGHRAITFRTPGDLDSDCIWITNQTFQQALRCRLQNNQKLRRSDFFRVELERIAVELNLDLKNGRDRAITYLSQVADRTVNLAKTIYQFDRVKDTLRKTIEDVVFDKLEMEEKPYLADAIAQSFKPYQYCYGARNPDYVDYYLRFPRTTYAKLISQLPVPSGGWRRVSDKLPLENKTVRAGVNSQVYAFLEELTDKRPALLKVSVTEVDPRFAHLLDYGQGSEQREWVPLPEVAQIAAYANVKILDMLVADGIEKPAEQFAKYLQSMDQSREASYSFGLVCESHLHAMFSKRKQTVHGQQKSCTSARASWLRAWDRVICFSAAAEIEKCGFRVLSYGIGNIQVSSSEGDLAKLLQVSKRLKLTAPMKLHEDIEKSNEMKDLLEHRALSDGGFF